MKKFVWLSAIILIIMQWFSVNSAEAQHSVHSKKLYSGVLKFRPLQYGELYISYEHVQDSAKTFEFGAGFIHKSHVLTDSERDESFLGIEQTKATGFAFRAIKRSYTRKKRLDGFYIGPTLTYRLLAFQKDLLKQHYSQDKPGRMYQHVLALNLNIGQQFLPSERFTIDCFIGFGAKAKFAHARNSYYSMERRIIGSILKSGENYVIAATTSFNLNFAVGYIFY